MDDRTIPLREAIQRSFSVFSKRDRFSIVIFGFLQVVLSFFDLIGVALVGFIGLLSVSGVQSKSPAGNTLKVLEIFGIAGSKIQIQVAVLACVASMVLITKTVMSIVVTKKTLNFVSQRSAKISVSLLAKLLNQSLLEIQKKSSQETLFAITSGVSAITIGVVATSISLIADVSLTLVLFIGILFVDPLSSLFTAGFFIIIALVLHKFSNKRSQVWGQASADLSIEVNKKILEVVSSYKETVVKNTRQSYISAISKLRNELAAVEAEMNFLPNVNKYVLEFSILLGAVSISGILFAIFDAQRAVGALSIFLVVGMRIGPSVLRIQQSFVTIKSSTRNGLRSLELVEKFQNVATVRSPQVPEASSSNHEFQGVVKMENVSFKYSSDSDFAIENVSLDILQGQIIALVGPSGAGKSTLVDLILGMFPPTHGGISISGESPLTAFSKWPGMVGYVPQEIFILDSTLRDNITMGYPDNEFSDARIADCLSLADLMDFVETLPNGIDTLVGERGSKISGGQRQRLGIARALFSNPSLLVLDEATSALDGNTEANITNSIKSLKGRVTVILIAHRLSTVVNADQIIYLDRGSIIASGTFSELRELVPDFAKQSALLA